MLCSSRSSTATGFKLVSDNQKALKNKINADYLNIKRACYADYHKNEQLLQQGSSVTPPPPVSPRNHPWLYSKIVRKSYQLALRPKYVPLCPGMCVIIISFVFMKCSGRRYSTAILAKSPGTLCTFCILQELSSPSPPETMLVFWRSTCDNWKISRARQLQVSHKGINIVLGGRGVHVCSNYDNM